VKPLVALLAVSAAVNIVLIGALVMRPASELPAGPRDGGESSRAVVGRAGSSTEVGVENASKLPPTVLRSALAKMDLPTEVVDALVLARIFAPFEARRREFFQETLKLPWWQSALVVTAGSRQKLFTTAQRKELRDLEASARDEALRLLGPQALDRDGAIAARHAFVAPEKAVLLDALLRDYDGFGDSLKEETGGLRTAADRERERFLAAERQRDLAALLAPEELERFDLRASPVAEQIQWRLGGFDPTEAEYRAVFAVHKAFAEQNPGPVSLEGRARRYDFSSVPEFNQQLRDALGDARLADWKRAGQSHFHALDRLAPELGISSETVKHVGALLSNTAARSWEIGENTTMTTAEKTTALAALSATARAEVTTKLGVAGTEKFLRDSVSWLNLMAAGNAITLLESGGISSRPVDRPTRPSLRK
jgi:hypothetical protein